MSNIFWTTCVKKAFSCRTVERNGLPVSHIMKTLLVKTSEIKLFTYKNVTRLVNLTNLQQQTFKVHFVYYWKTIFTFHWQKWVNPVQNQSEKIYHLTHEQSGMAYTSTMYWAVQCWLIWQQHFTVSNLLKKKKKTIYQWAFTKVNLTYASKIRFVNLIFFLVYLSA